MELSITVRPPLIAIIGRPNVGKSTLFNRITGTRRSIVGDEPGITRDRIYAHTEWQGRQFELVDTGGMLPGEDEVMPQQIFKHAHVAIEQADQVVMVVDGRAEITGTDRELARLLLRTGKPLVLAVNKADAARHELAMQEWHALGFKRVFFISAEHGHGIADLLDEVTKDLPISEAEEQEGRDPGLIRVAIIGKPNVGKSTLLNLISGEERSIVTPVAGTTRDAVDLLVESPIAGRLQLVDTAGIRRKAKTKLMAEKLSVMMAQRHVRMCDVAVLMIDATEGATSQDSAIARYAHENGKGIVLVVNKWDLIENKKYAAGKLNESLRRTLSFLDYAPVQFLSATTGWNVDKLMTNIRDVAAARSHRIPTAELNKFFETLDLIRARMPAARRVKIFYLTQAGVRPPTFILFTDKAQKLDPAFERYLENQFRRQFGFPGTPLVFKTRGRRETHGTVPGPSRRGQKRA